MSAAAASATSSALARTTNSGNALELLHQLFRRRQRPVEHLVMSAGRQEVKQQGHLVQPLQLLDVAERVALADLDDGQQHPSCVLAAPLWKIDVRRSGALGVEIGRA